MAAHHLGSPPLLKREIIYNLPSLSRNHPLPKSTKPRAWASGSRPQLHPCYYRRLGHDFRSPGAEGLDFGCVNPISVVAAAPLSVQAKVPGHSDDLALFKLNKNRVRRPSDAGDLEEPVLRASDVRGVSGVLDAQDESGHRDLRVFAHFIGRGFDRPNEDGAVGAHAGTCPWAVMSGNCIHLNLPVTRVNYASLLQQKPRCFRRGFRFWRTGVLTISARFEFSGDLGVLARYGFVMISGMQARFQGQGVLIILARFPCRGVIAGVARVSWMVVL